MTTARYSRRSCDGSHVVTSLKGCRLCKPHKHAGNGDAVRKSVGELRQVGKARRVRRRELGDAAER